MGTRTRAVLLATDYHPMVGGIARLLTDLVTETRDAVDWQILTLAPGKPETDVFRAHNRRHLVSLVLRSARWLRSGSDRLLVCGHVTLLGHAIVASTFTSVPITTLAYGMELVPRGLRQRAVLRALPASGRVVAISNRSAESVRKLGVRPERIRVVNPVGVRAIRGDIPRVRAEHEALRLVAVTRLVEGYKNLELLLRMVRVLAGSGMACRLTIIGDGPRRLALEEKARSMGVGAIVDFVGRLSDEAMDRLLREAHVGLFPSRESTAEGGFEGFGLVVHELASSGVPVLVGWAGGAVDAAGPSWSVLLDPDDLRAWVRAVDHLATDEPSRMGMAESALEWAGRVDRRGAAYRLLQALRV